jgi:hypothetical protein
LRGLLKGVSQLQDGKILLMAANDLQPDRQAVFGKSAWD